MFDALARRRIRGSFEALGRGDYSLALAGLAEDVHHVFAGNHALGGERHSRDAVRRWFERLFRLYDLRFHVQRVFVAGPPWDLVVGVEWIGYATPKVGDPYINDGVHVIRIRRGRVVYFHAYEDSQKVADVPANGRDWDRGGRCRPDRGLIQTRRSVPDSAPVRSPDPDDDYLLALAVSRRSLPPAAICLVVGNRQYREPDVGSLLTVVVIPCGVGSSRTSPSGVPRSRAQGRRPTVGA